MITLKTYNKPTDIFIIGTVFDNNDYGFTTTDDYDILKFLNIGNWIRASIETTGCIGIYTKEEISKVSKDVIQEFIEDHDDYEYIYLPNYTGDINLVIEKHIGNGRFQAIDDNEFNINQGCYYQDSIRDNYHHEFCKTYLVFNEKENAKLRDIKKLLEL